MPDFNKQQAVVKLNTAAIKKEGYQIKKKEQEEQKMLKDFEMNLRDEREFERWKQEMDEKQEIEHMEHIQKMKIEMELSRQDAIDAQKRKEKENKLNADKMKLQSMQRIDEKDEMMREDLEKKKEVIDGVQ